MTYRPTSAALEGNNCLNMGMAIEKEFERRSNPAYLVTSTQLSEVVWMSVCRFQMVTEMVGSIPPNSDVGKVGGLRHCSTIDKHCGLSIQTPLVKANKRLQQLLVLCQSASLPPFTWTQPNHNHRESYGKHCWRGNRLPHMTGVKAATRTYPSAVAQHGNTTVSKLPLKFAIIFEITDFQFV